MRVDPKVSGGCAGDFPIGIFGLRGYLKRKEMCRAVISTAGAGGFLVSAGYSVDTLGPEEGFFKSKNPGLITHLGIDGNRSIKYSLPSCSFEIPASPDDKKRIEAE
jgi:hypothetical protein